MMFPKGPRFVPPKIPDVPGPNTYNPTQESQLDAYKRGAFLEKTDRFSKDKPSDVPGPGTYNSESKPTMTKSSTKQSAPPPNLADRYATLQRKLEDLERVHHEGKKTQQAELDRIKSDLARSQKANMEHIERHDKLKKQNEALDARVHELKKATSADQAELKDLRMKLRVLEQETAKQGEAGEAKKALDARRREEVRVRDRRIAELEKTLGSERKKREAAEAKLSEAKEKVDGEVRDARDVAQGLRVQLDAAREDERLARSSLEALESEAGAKEEDLLAQLSQHQQLLARAASEYGHLASQTISASEHSRAKFENATLQLRAARLERKLANTEGQVTELANLVRHTKEENTLLKVLLRDAEEEAQVLSGVGSDIRMSMGNESPYDELAKVGDEINEEERRKGEFCVAESEMIGDFYRLKCEELLFSSSVLDKAFTSEKAQVQKQNVELSMAVAARDSFASQVEAVRAAHEVALKKEREIAQRLSAAVQQNRIAEEELRAEIEQLTVELTDAERFQEAYYSLTDEVGALLDRKALAEDEAQRLSKFNAEILGHNNPAQRIMYVDRIRRELAEMKQKLLLSTRAHDAATVDNDELRHELDMYRSVLVPPEQKPRTHITRVGRAPLASQCLNVGVNGGGDSAAKNVKVGGKRTPEPLESIPGDMTVDEIM